MRAAAALLVVAFADGTARELVPRELVEDPDWVTSGLFTRGGALYCSGLQGMMPTKAAPILSALGCEVTWQIEDRDASTHTYQTTTAPSQGRIDEGLQNRRELVIVVMLGDGPISHGSSSSCPA